MSRWEKRKKRKNKDQETLGEWNIINELINDTSPLNLVSDGSDWFVVASSPGLRLLHTCPVTNKTWVGLSISLSLGT